MAQNILTRQAKTMYPLAESRTRLSVWEKARQNWKVKKPLSSLALSKLRKEWERKLPKLK